MRRAVLISRVRRLVLGCLAGIALGLGFGSAASAATITVNCTADANALTNALESASDGDTLEVQGTCEGTFVIDRSLTLAGVAGAALHGPGGLVASPVLQVNAGETVAVNDLTITGGRSGGIFNMGALTLTESRVSGNSATGTSFGIATGGIVNQGGSLTVVSSIVSGNSAGASAFSSSVAGGVWTNGGTVALIGSTVSGNSASSPSVALGGIVNSGGSVSLTNSTVSGNSASAVAGVSGVSGVAVGGIGNSGGSLTLTNSTLSGNSASEPNGGFLPPVGGIENIDGGTPRLASSLIAGESGIANCFGLVASSDGGYNLDDGSSCGFSTANHSLSNTSPLLDPAGLQDNGGLTPTVALLAGSPAVDAIPVGMNGCGTTLSADQRGVSRPQGPGCDIGAFELVQETPAQLLAELADLVQGVGPGASLAQKLARARAYLIGAGVPDTCSILNAFIREVNAQSGKAVAPALADDLVARAQRIEGLLNCS